MTITIDITRQDYYELNKFHFKQTKLKNTIIIGIVVTTLILFFVNKDGFDITITLLIIIVCSFGIILGINRNLKSTKNLPDEQGSILGERVIQFTDDKISYKMKNAQGINEWDSVKSLKESSTAFYLYLDTAVAIIIPKRYFEDADQIKDFKILVNNNLVHQ
ncbi:YcxB family protein [Pedobacter frigidisoli]|uniref:YcxB family protein n=1 Tax=Pedobacter frigidisoli TaxID=2530455 RepID=A0A4R0P5T2_9SPHI|nr:YcxB family protein [Pedobacter frigidisoli]TCD11251.1 YcxB family protein [Pedobacter frigidisoli]